MKGLLVLMLALAALALEPNDLTVDGQWEGSTVTMRAQIPYQRLENFDRTRDGRLSQDDLNADRPGVRERLVMLLALRSRGVTLRPKVQTWEEGRTSTHVGLLLTFNLPPQTIELTLRAGLGTGEKCLGRLNDEEFTLTDERPEKSFRSFAAGGQAEYFLALGTRLGLAHCLFVLCLLLPGLSTRDLLETLAAYVVGHSLTLALGAWGVLPAQDFFPSLGLIAAAGLNLARPELPTRWPLALIFGLVHGLGLAAGAHPVGVQLLWFGLGVEVSLALLVCLAWPLLK